jgi:hypothetical protein
LGTRSVWLDNPRPTTIGQQLFGGNHQPAIRRATRVHTARPPSTPNPSAHTRALSRPGRLPTTVCRPPPAHPQGPSQRPPRIDPTPTVPQNTTTLRQESERGRRDHHTRGHTKPNKALPSTASSYHLPLILCVACAKWMLFVHRNTTTTTSGTKFGTTRQSKRKPAPRTRSTSRAPIVCAGDKGTRLPPGRRHQLATRDRGADRHWALTRTRSLARFCCIQYDSIAIDRRHSNTIILLYRCNTG